MREVITLQIGGCGNAIGESFWDVISNEHGINPNGEFKGTDAIQMDKLNAFFEENEPHYARAICIDMNESCNDKICKGTIGKLFKPNNFISTNSAQSGKNFAKCFCSTGENIVESIMNTVRHEVELCESVEGFQIIHSTGGGTGSGLTSLLINNLNNEFKKNIIQTISVLPSSLSGIADIYNTVLMIPHLQHKTHLSYCINDFAGDALGQVHNVATANKLIALTLSGITTGLRFPDLTNLSLRKLYVNMCPFPDLHFLLPGFAPFPCEDTSSMELVTNLFDSKRMLANIDLHRGQTLTATAIFRGNIEQYEINSLMKKVRDKNSYFFVDWIPNNIQIALCSVPPKDLNMASTFIGNTTAIREMFGGLLKIYAKNFKRKTFLHNYQQEGLDEADFNSAAENLKSLIQEYSNYEEKDA